MGLGSTAKKLQRVADVAEEMYARLNEVRGTLASVEDTIDDTHGRVEELERQVAQQRALLEALAEREDVDVEAALAAVDDGPADDGGSADGDGSGEAGDAGDDDPDASAANAGESHDAPPL